MATSSLSHFERNRITSGAEDRSASFSRSAISRAPSPDLSDRSRFLDPLRPERPEINSLGIISFYYQLRAGLGWWPASAPPSWRRHGAAAGPPGPHRGRVRADQRVRVAGPAALVGCRSRPRTARFSQRTKVTYSGFLRNCRDAA